MSRACKNCEWWSKTYDKPSVWGRCRVDPPRLNDDTAMGIWPEVDEDQWCSRFIERNQEAKDGWVTPSVYIEYHGKLPKENIEDGH